MSIAAPVPIPAAHVHFGPPVRISQLATPGATSMRIRVNGPQSLMPAPSHVGSSPMPTPEFSLHAADTGTSLSSEVSLPSAQPGSSRSVWPSLSSSAPFAHALPAGAVGVGVGVLRGAAGCRRPPLAGPAAGPDGAGGAGAAPRPSCVRIVAAFAGAGFPHSFAASTTARPFMSAGPFRRLASSWSRPGQDGALPPSSAAATVLKPFGLPMSVSTTFPFAAPRGRMTATASFPRLTPPATVTPTGADCTFMRLTPEANVTATCPSAGSASDFAAACAAGPDISRTPSVRSRTRNAGSMPRSSTPAP